MTNHELHQEFAKLGRERNRITYELLYLLPEIAKRGIHREKGFLTVCEYAGRVAGLGKTTVDKTLRVAKLLEDKPSLMAAIRTEGIHKVALVASLATVEDEARWAEKLVGMSKSALEELSRELRAKKKVSRSDSKCQAAEQKLTITLEGELLFEFLKLKQRLEKKEKVHLSNVQAVGRMIRELSLIQKGSQDKAALQLSQNPSPVMDCLKIRRRTKGLTAKCLKSTGKPVTRYIPQWQKSRIIASTEGRCAYAGCSRPYEQLHHRDRFAVQKSHESLVPLCKIHHQFAHNRLIAKESTVPEEWQLTLEVDPGLVDRKVLQFW